MTSAQVGYTGGTLQDPTYQNVCSGTTGHAEAVEVDYDPDLVSYEDLLDVFWNNHDPTTRNRQGPDVGTQYRSAIFFHSPEQEAAAVASKQKLEASGRFSNPIATEITAASEFYRAEELREGTADPEAILRRFTRSNVQHPTYLALSELGEAVKTISLCRYLQSETRRREIHEGLNVVENWNSTKSFIFYGKGGEVASNRLEEQELSVLSLHLLQICLVYVNTLMIQSVLGDRAWSDELAPENLRALSPLIYNHVNPYGIFELDMEQRIPFGTRIAA